MVRERLVEAQELEGERKLQWSLRPQCLDEYVGQAELRVKLTIALEAARWRGEPLEHLLLYGPPGLGKTTLAHIISYEMGSSIVCTSGPVVERSGDLMGILTNLQEGDILFIDEIHRLPRAVEEFLYPAMEDFQIDFVVDKGAFAKTVKITLKPFTLIGATTRAGLLTAPLRERFGLLHHLDFYPAGELAVILQRSAGLLEVPLEEEAGQEIARRSRGTPRVANRLLKRVRDYAQVRADGRITLPVALAALELEGVDAAGLDNLDRQFLRTIAEIYRGGPVGIEALSATLNEQSDTLQDMVEPFLLKTGFLSRTPGGRRLTGLGWQHLGMVAPADTLQENFWGSGK